MAEISPQDDDLCLGPERSGQKSIGMQLLQPLTIFYVGFASRKILGLASVDDAYMESTALLHLEEGYPIDSSGLHRYGLDSALHQPIRQRMQI